MAILIIAVIINIRIFLFTEFMFYKTLHLVKSLQVQYNGWSIGFNFTKEEESLVGASNNLIFKLLNGECQTRGLYNPCSLQWVLGA